MNLIITGPQGSGKGTQADLLAEKLGLFHMESGKMLRKIAKEDGRIKKMLDNGVLVPDQETIEYMESYLKRNSADFSKLIFDGYPRNVEQYKLLKKWLRSFKRKIDNAIYLEIDEEVSVKRIGSRRTCSVCSQVYNLITNPPPSPEKCECGGSLKTRDDDKPDAIRKRLEIFNKKTKQLLGKYIEDGILIKIDAAQPIDIIFRDILKKLGVKHG